MWGPGAVYQWCYAPVAYLTYMFELKIFELL